MSVFCLSKLSLSDRHIRIADVNADLRFLWGRNEISGEAKRTIQGILKLIPLRLRELTDQLVKACRRWDTASRVRLVALKLTLPRLIFCQLDLNCRKLYLQRIIAADISRR